MKLGVLFSGGKDSCAAAYIAQQYGHDVTCLLSIQSDNKDSYMFHTPNISLVELQAEAMGLPIIIRETEGEKEEELLDLKALIREAIKIHGIKGIVTGAVASVYQTTRVQKICHELNIWCFNPLWQRDPLAHVIELVHLGFEMYIGAIAAYPLTEDWLGKRITKDVLLELKELQEKHQVNPAGEGGEFETFVAHGPGWKQKIVIKEAKNVYDNYAGVWEIQKTELKKEELVPKKIIVQPTQGSTLLISTCQEKLSELEFVQPIARILKDDCTIIHYKEQEIIEQELENHSHIIICGTTIKDDTFLNHLNLFNWVNETDKPVLGICAGFQILGMLNGGELIENVEIGMKRIRVFDEEHEVYLLHHNNSKNLGYHFREGNKESVLFHPEVRMECVVKEFLAY